MNKIAKMSLVAVLSLFVAGCGNGDAQKQAAQAQKAKMAAMTLPVGMVVVKTADIPIEMRYSAQIVSEKDVVVRAKVSGNIEQQFFKAGQRVKKDEKLYEIDKAKYQAAFDVATANLRVAQASYKNAKAEFERSSGLFKKRVLSQKEFDAATAAYESARAGVALANASLTSAKLDLSYAEVSAPFDGVVGDTQKSIGSFVSASDGALVRLTELNPIYVKFGIADTQKLTIDQNINDGSWEQVGSRVTLEANGKIYEGTLEFIDNVIDEKSGTVSAKAKFENPNFELRTGAFARITLYGFTQKNGVKLPQIAVLQDLSNPYVLVINKDGIIEKRIISISSQDAVNAVVSNGLQNGDMVVMDNFKKIRVGQKVQPVPYTVTSEQMLMQMQKQQAAAAKQGAKK